MFSARHDELWGLLTMAKEKTGKISSIFTVVFVFWFILTPVFWHLDLSMGNYGSYDMFVMAPLGVLHLVIFFALGFISIYLGGLSFYHVLLFGAYFPFIQLSNYPILTIRDAYLHSAPTRTILETGHLPVLSGANPESWSGSWPSSFFLQGILVTVSGCDLIVANYILYLVLIIALCLIVYSFARKFRKKGYELAWAGALLFLCFFLNHLFDNFHHYARTPLGFVFLFFFFYSFIGLSDQHSPRSRIGLQLLLCISLVITHPFQSLALVAFLFAYSIITRKSESVKLALFSIVTFIGWVGFQGSVFSEGVGMLKAFLSPQFLEPVVETFSSSERMVWWGIVLRDFYKYSLLAFFAVAFLAAIVVIWRRQRTSITVGLSSVLLSSIVLFFCLLILPDWQINRFTAFAAFPAAFSSLILFEEALKKGKLKKLLWARRLLSKRSTFAILLLFVISLSAAVMVLRFERNYYYNEMSHSSELSSLNFFFDHDPNSTVTFVSWRTQIYSSYFDNNSSHQRLRIWYSALIEYAGNSSKFFEVQGQLINQSQFVIRGMRDSYMLSQYFPGEALPEIIDEELVASGFEMIYSNGHYWIYKRAGF